MLVRVGAMALAAALAGCASGYGGGYDYYPGETYYDDPYYGGGFGSYYDNDYDRYDRYFHPADNVSCDRKRDICYDRFGPSYYATARYLGESEANDAYHKYGDSVFLFSPRDGVSCDRRTKECSDGQWTGSAAPSSFRRSDSGFVDDGQPVRRVMPTRRTNDDETVTRRVAPQVEAAPSRMADSDDDVVRPSRRIQPEKPAQYQRQNSDDKVRDGGAGSNSGGNGCPPRGCTD